MRGCGKCAAEERTERGDKSSVPVPFLLHRLGLRASSYGPPARIAINKTYSRDIICWDRIACMLRAPSPQLITRSIVLRTPPNHIHSTIRLLTMNFPYSSRIFFTLWRLMVALRLRLLQRQRASFLGRSQNPPLFLFVLRCLFPSELTRATLPRCMGRESRMSISNWASRSPGTRAAGSQGRCRA